MRSKHIIVPSVLERTVAKAQHWVDVLEPLGAPLQFDLMDGQFVRTRSMARSELRLMDVPQRTTAHLMVKKPKQWIPACRAIGIRRFAIHVESEISAQDVREISRRDKIISVINPGTNVRALIPFLPFIDGVQVMTIRPGRQGAPFIRSQLSVVRRLRKRHPTLWIAADGGMNARTIPLAVKAGVNEFIVGSALTRAADPGKLFRKLVALLDRTS